MLPRVAVVIALVALAGAAGLLATHAKHARGDRRMTLVFGGLGALAMLAAMWEVAAS